jgi:hypothetical protein
MDSEQEPAAELAFDNDTLKKLVPALIGVFMVNLNVSVIAPFFPV